MNTAHDTGKYAAYAIRGGDPHEEHRMYANYLTSLAAGILQSVLADLQL